MSPKELLVWLTLSATSSFWLPQCAEAESALSDPQLKQCVRQLQNAHRQIFNQLMALV